MATTVGFDTCILQNLVRWMRPGAANAMDHPAIRAIFPPLAEPIDTVEPPKNPCPTSLG